MESGAPFGLWASILVGGNLVPSLSNDG
jgi:hypothetical protein